MQWGIDKEQVSDQLITWLSIHHRSGFDDFTQFCFPFKYNQRTGLCFGKMLTGMRNGGDGTAPNRHQLAVLLR